MAAHTNVFPRAGPSLHFDRYHCYDRPVEAKGVSVARVDLPQGTLDLLIRKTLALKPQHGWGIPKRIRPVSRDVLQVEWGGVSVNNRRA